jgi:hypothetical protein
LRRSWNWQTGTACGVSIKRCVLRDAFDAAEILWVDMILSRYLAVVLEQGFFHDHSQFFFSKLKSSHALFC